ncbi:MAG: bifunctional proline dehydrogenase/L-glutamate gamma-semialdehyde dehydrogenase PutA, partial [Motiliproteus sp.]
SQIIDFHQQSGKDFECQRLHGMGESLYRRFHKDYKIPCRIYAPVGNHKELLPYLVRRLLENGANSSFVSRIVDPSVAATDLVGIPQQIWHSETPPGLPLPADLYAPRINSKGINLQIYSQRKPLLKNLNNIKKQTFISAPIINGEPLMDSRATAVLSPQNMDQIIGEAYHTNASMTEQAIKQVSDALPVWSKQPTELRARILERFADSLENQAAELIHLCIYEAGKTLQDSLDELREAVDFCRYYALKSRELIATPLQLPGITGESNRLQLEPRGIFVCISPWNFPLSIFVGQTTAALVCGNGVIAKPARQTSLIAYRCCQLLLDAGLPPGIFALLPGPSENFSETLLSHPHIRGVAFTGSTATAQHINLQLALRKQAPIAAIIAETGGQNAMIADSTALPEQIVKDAIESAFGSSGQRCSALRVLFLQEEIADNVTELLIGAMKQLKQGAPELLETDLGPVIDQEALNKLNRHLQAMQQQGNLLHQLTQPRALRRGYYFSPALIKLERIDQLQEEHFGPILHIVRYPADQLMRVVDDINLIGYGLTLSIHSRNETHIRQIEARAHIGNIYVNRNQTGAVVEAQPFGGQGLSGTGPKAGGPNYLMHFLYEKTITTNTTAWGGNAPLLSGHREPE